MFTSQQLPSIIEMIRNQGRNGDTMLAHINPQEAEMLQSMGGSGTINPNTGLPEFFFGLLPEMILRSPAKSLNSSFFSRMLADPERTKKIIESTILGATPATVNKPQKPPIQHKKPLPKETITKEIVAKLKENNISPFRRKSNQDDDSNIFGGMFDALPSIAKSGLNKMGSIATKALLPISETSQPALGSNLGNIIKKMNPEELGYAMSGRWGE
jgi:hypothetical protein